MEETVANVGITLTYILFAIAAIGAVIVPVALSIVNQNWQALVKVAAGIGALLVVFLVAWAISGNEVGPVHEKFGIDASSSKLVGGALIMTYLLGFIAVGGIVFGFVKSLMKSLS
jgi:hypothetical protein